MIDLKRLHWKVKAAYAIVYFVYALGVSGFALLVAVEALVSRLDILGELDLSPEAVALLGLALVAPLAPFAQQIGFGGAGATLPPMTPDKADELEGRIGRGVALAVAEMSARGLPDLIEGGSAEGSARG